VKEKLMDWWFVQRKQKRKTELPQRQPKERLQILSLRSCDHFGCIHPLPIIFMFGSIIISH